MQKKYINLLRVSKIRSKKKEQSNYNMFLEELDLLFDISTSDFKQRISQDRGHEKVQEDLTFLEDQKGERKMIVSGEDKDYLKKVINLFCK